jgi:hypothetical protein
MKTTKTQDQVAQFVHEANRNGFKIEVINSSVVRITKDFTPNSKEAFTEADMMAGSILGLAPLKGGSVWGTDGGSVGGYSGLIRGQYILNKSGEGKRFVSALRKVI